MEGVVGDGRSEIEWSRRVPKWQIRRLYESDAQGMLDEELLDDVGITLLLRCRDILAIHEAKRGRIECPRCAGRGERTVIKRGVRQGDVRDEVITCSECGWQITWGEYTLSFKRKQLNSGGAVEAFQRYVRDYSAARTPQEKLLAVDRLIHEFHYSLRDQPDRPCRPVGVNLIEGKLPDVVQFLDELAYGKETPEDLRVRLADWRGEMRRTFWPDLVGPDEDAEV